MTTNMFEIINSVLKGTRNLPITALIQLTFFHLRSYFVARREQGAIRLTSNEQYTLYVDAQIKAYVVMPQKYPRIFIIILLYIPGMN